MSLNTVKLMMVAICILSSFETTRGLPATVNLFDDRNCGQTSQRLTGVYLISSNNPPPQFYSNVTCLYTMYAYKNRQDIVFTITYFDLFPNDCSTTKLAIYNGRDDTPENLLKTICPGDSAPITVRGTAFYMTVVLEAEIDIKPVRVNFCGYFTTYEDRSAADDPNVCSFPSEERMCNNGRCVNVNLTCDGLDACGDASDESSSTPFNCDLSTIPDNNETCPFGANTTTVKGNGSNVYTTQSPSNPLTDNSIHKIAALSTILTVAGALFLAYTFYWLLSIASFNRAVTGCFRKCLLNAMRRRKYSSSSNEERKSTSFGSNSKITPMVEDLE